MHFVSGSHRRPEQVLLHQPAPNQTINPLTSLGFNELAVATGSEADSWANSHAAPLPAGGAAFWLPRTLHGSAGNSSPIPRKALLMSASCDPTPLSQPFERPWRAEVRAGQTGEVAAGSDGAVTARRRRPEDETGLDPNGAAAAPSAAAVVWCANASAPRGVCVCVRARARACVRARVRACLVLATSDDMCERCSGRRRRRRPPRRRGGRIAASASTERCEHAAVDYSGSSVGVTVDCLCAAQLLACCSLTHYAESQRHESGDSNDCSQDRHGGRDCRLPGEPPLSVSLP